MRSGKPMPEATSGLDEAGPSRWRSASIRFPACHCTRIGLILACAALLLGIPTARDAPESRPARRTRGTSGPPIRRPAFGADGRTIATVDGRGRVMVRQAVDDPGLERALDIRGYARAVAFSPDGRYLAVGRGEPDIILCCLDGAEPGRDLGIPVRDTSDVAFSPDGRMLAVSGSCSNGIILWDLEAARERMTLRGHSTPVTISAFGPEGRSLASVARDEPAILIWDLSGGRPRRRLVGLLSPPFCIAWSPDGRFMASACCSERVVRIWDVEEAREVRLIAGHTLSTRSLAFSPDGRLLATASGDGSAGLWSIATGREVRRLDPQADVLHGIAFSADGKSLAAIGNDGDVRLWNMASLVEDRANRD